MSDIITNPFALLGFRYGDNGSYQYYLVLREHVNRIRDIQSRNITNIGGIQIINMPGQPPSQNDTQFIIVTSDSPPPPPDGDGGRIRIIPVSAQSEVDNTLRLIRRALFLLDINMHYDTGRVEDDVNAVINLLHNKLQKAGRYRRSSSTRRRRGSSSTKKRTSARGNRQRQRQRQRPRHSRRRAH